MDFYGLLWLFPNIFVVWILFERDSTGEGKQVRKFFAHPSFPPPLSIRRWWSKEGKKKTPPPPPSLFSGQGLRRNGGSGSEMEFQNAIINALLPQDDGSKKKNWKNKNWQFSRESAVRSRPPIMRLKGVF